MADGRGQSHQGAAEEGKEGQEPLPAILQVAPDRTHHTADRMGFAVRPNGNILVGGRDPLEQFRLALVRTLDLRILGLGAAVDQPCSHGVQGIHAGQVDGVDRARGGVEQVRQLARMRQGKRA